MALERIPVRPPHLGDDPCAICGQPGSVCPDCGQAFCSTHNLNPHVAPDHEPDAHLVAPPIEPETETQRLAREIREMEQRINGTEEDRLRRRHAQLKAHLDRLAEDHP